MSPDETSEIYGALGFWHAIWRENSLTTTKFSQPSRYLPRLARMARANVSLGFERRRTHAANAGLSIQRAQFLHGP